MIRQLKRKIKVLLNQNNRHITPIPQQAYDFSDMLDDVGVGKIIDSGVQSAASFPKYRIRVGVGGVGVNGEDFSVPSGRDSMKGSKAELDPYSFRPLGDAGPVLRLPVRLPSTL